MTDGKLEAEMLDSHFEAACRHIAEPSEEVMRNVLADALDVQADRAAEPLPVPARQGWLGQMVQALGGWPAMTGLGTAAVAGLWLGIYSPAGMQSVTQAVLGEDDAIYLIDISMDGAFGLSEGAM